MALKPCESGNLIRISSLAIKGTLIQKHRTLISVVFLPSIQTSIEAEKALDKPKVKDVL